MRPILLLVPVLALTAAPACAQRILVSSLLGESSVLIAPVVQYTVRDSLREFRAGITGWTLNAQWSRHQSATRTRVVTAELTPLNSRLSNRQFVDGELDESLAYRNATAQLSAGLRWTGHRRWTTEARVVALHEFVGDLPSDVEAFWRAPFVGVDLVQRLDWSSNDDPIRGRFDGVRTTARVQAYGGSATWGLGTLTMAAGRRVGRLHVRSGATLVHGEQLNTVSAFLTGGSWDATGATALYGHAHGTYRIERGVLVNGGVDVRLAGTTELAIRGSHLDAPGQRAGGVAAQISTAWRGGVIAVGVARPVVDRRAPTLVTMGVTQALVW